ncbi:hypothetical protein JZU46_00780 [bacterium]|nr:hypothetical protein [bacterium]
MKLNLAVFVVFIIWLGILYTQATENVTIDTKIQRLVENIVKDCKLRTQTMIIETWNNKEAYSFVCADDKEVVVEASRLKNFLINKE